MQGAQYIHRRTSILHREGGKRLFRPARASEQPRTSAPLQLLAADRRSTTMNDSYAVLADMYSAIAAERTRSILTEARYDGLARLSRGCSPHRLAAGRAHVLDGL